MQEHRHISRWQINRPAKVRLVGAQVFTNCIIKDINFKGMQISLGIKLPKDTFLKLNLILSEEFSLDVEAWVVWHRTIDGFNLYALYFSKLRDLDKEKIYKFTQRYVPQEINKQWQKDLSQQKGGEKMEDRRIFARFPATFSLRFLDLNKNWEGLAQTSDISAKGIGMELSEELVPRTSLEMWLNIPDRFGPLYIRGKIVWSKMVKPSKYRAGVELEKADLMGLSRVLRTV